MSRIRKGLQDMQLTSSFTLGERKKFGGESKYSRKAGKKNNQREDRRIRERLSQSLMKRELYRLGMSQLEVERRSQFFKAVTVHNEEFITLRKTTGWDKLKFKEVRFTREDLIKFLYKKLIKLDEWELVSKKRVGTRVKDNRDHGTKRKSGPKNTLYLSHQAREDRVKTLRKNGRRKVFHPNGKTEK